ncbi:unnamed protein product, partial [Adineta steineri]
MERREVSRQPLAYHLGLVKNDRKQKPLDTDDNDSDSKQTVEELKRPSTGRKSLPTNRGSLSTVEYNVSHGNLSERRSYVPTRNSETEEHDDSDSNQTAEELKRPSTGRKSLP